jgi:DNA-3-methyladenine glycosylase II
MYTFIYMLNYQSHTESLRLNEENLIVGANYIANRDHELAQVLVQYGYPPLWKRTATFSTLVHIILEQQVSLASANATYNRLNNLLQQHISPHSLLTLKEEELKNIGFSRQKVQYAHNLATQIVENKINLEELDRLSDNQVKQELKKLKGIGDWTADIFLSECLLRTNILPKGDIAMLEAFKLLKNLEKRPDHEQFVQGTLHWQPWRSVGTRMLWHFYLSRKR